jgi:hypothetical protein
MGAERSEYKVLTINAEGRRPLGTSRRRWEGSGSERSRK